MSFTAAVHGTLLLVDDDNRQLEACAMVLEMSGFSVLTAASPHEAISVTAQHAIDIAVLDYEMPGMNGCMLAKHIRTRCQDIRIILYSGALVIPKHELANVDVFVSKGKGVAPLLAQISQLTRKPAESRGTLLDSPVASTANRNRPLRAHFDDARVDFLTPTPQAEV